MSTTIKFSHNGTTYSLVANTARVTTPSIIIDNNSYIPLIESTSGDLKVIGDNVYTLSPFTVDKNLKAPSAVENLKGDISFSLVYYMSSSVEGDASSTSRTTTNYYLGIIGCNFSNSKFTLELSDLNGISMGVSEFDTYVSAWNYHSVASPNWCTKTIEFTGTYTLKMNNTTVKTGTFSSSVTLNFEKTTESYTTVTASV